MRLGMDRPPTLRGTLVDSTRSRIFTTSPVNPGRKQGRCLNRHRPYAKISRPCRRLRSILFPPASRHQSYQNMDGRINHKKNRIARRIRAQPVDFGEENGSSDEETSDTRNFVTSGERKENPDERLMAISQSQSRPIVYQFFGKSLRRSRQSDAVPFVVLCPSVDHWRGVGRILSSRGFNVMACQRITEERDAKMGAENEADSAVHKGDGEALVLRILDALRWERAVIVGCGSEAAMAVDAALSLAPERVAGIILCGDLTSAESFVETLKPPPQHLVEQSLPYIDSFVGENLSCPCTIVWDGDLFTLPSFGDMPASRRKTYESFNRMRMTLEKRRALIVGGGLSPHRRLPDQFAWVLTRFIEKQLQELKKDDSGVMEDEYDGESETPDFHSPCLNAFTSGTTLGRDVNNPFRDNGPVEQFFSSGTFLVVGRYISRLLLYFSIFKIALHQLDNLKTGISVIQSSVSTINAWRRKGSDIASSMIASDWIIRRLPMLGENKSSADLGAPEDVDESQGQSVDRQENKEEPKPSYDDLFFDHRLILIDGVVT